MDDKVQTGASYHLYTKVSVYMEDFLNQWTSFLFVLCLFFILCVVFVIALVRC